MSLKHRAASLRSRRSAWPKAVERLEARTLLSVYATVIGAGTKPVVQLRDSRTGAVREEIQPFPDRYRGGLEVALGDVNADGVEDLVVAAGGHARVRSGEFASRVRVFDGRSGTRLAGRLGDFRSFGPAFRGGVSVAAGDVNNDGKADIIVGAGRGNGPQVRVFSGADGSLLSSALAFRRGFRGGVRVASAVFDAAKGADVIVAAGPGALPVVKRLDGRDLSVEASFLAYRRSFRGGVSVAAGDVNGDDTPDLITAPASGKGSQVRVFSGKDARLLSSFAAYGTEFRGGVRVGSVQFNRDGRADILTASAGRRGAVHKVFDGETRSLLASAKGGNSGLAAASIAGSSSGLEKAYCDTITPETVYSEFDPLGRLAIFGKPTQANPSGTYTTPTAGGVLADPDRPVYVIVHGWALGYESWANKILAKGDLPTWWDTFTDTSTTPASDWVYQPSDAAKDSEGNPLVVTPNGLATQIADFDPKATILLYSWIDESATAENPYKVYSSEARAQQNGIRLAQALMKALETDFAAKGGKVQLIGHSHGAKVATSATLALQKAVANDPVKNAKYDVVKQLTLLDSPEDQGYFKPSSYDGANLLWYMLAQLNISQTPLSTTNNVFVDSYISGFGNYYSNYDVSAEFSGSDLSKLLDVKLLSQYPFPSSVTDPGTSDHDFAPWWYAGSTSTGQNTNPVGIYWSPLVAAKSGVRINEFSTQTWTKKNYTNANLFDLASQKNPGTRTPNFSDLTLYQYSDNSVVDTVTLSDDSTDCFDVYFSKSSDQMGISFDFTFSGAAANTDDGQLQVYLNGNPYFNMSATLTEAFPGRGTFRGTLGVGYESSWFDQYLTFMLVPTKGSDSTPVSVTISNFEIFTLG